MHSQDDACAIWYSPTEWTIYFPPRYTEHRIRLRFWLETSSSSFGVKRHKSESNQLRPARQENSPPFPGMRTEGTLSKLFFIT